MNWRWIGLILAMIAFTGPAAAQSRIKDIATLENSGGQALIGTGMVMGLPGTGDNSRDTATVMITAQVSMGGVVGSTVDISVLAMGSARSLRGGTLLPTPLKNGAGQIWAIAQGPITSAGLVAQGAAQTVFQGNAASGTIPGGAVLEHDMPPLLDGSDQPIRLMLHQPDFTTAKRVADAINAAMGQKVARMRDNTVISLNIPPDYPDGAANFMAAIEGLTVVPDRGVNRIVLDARTGTVVAGADIPVAPSAISHGSLTVRITEAPKWSGAARSTIEVSDDSGQILASAPGDTVGSLLASLKAAGLSTFDQMAVLQSLHAAGSITAEVSSK